MRTLLGPIAVAVVLCACGTGPEVDVLFAVDDAQTGQPTTGGGGGGAGAGVSGSDGGQGGGGSAGETLTGGDGGSGGVPLDDGGDDGTAPLPTDASTERASPPASDASDGAAPKTIRCGGNANCDVATEYCCAELNNFRCLRRTQTTACPRFVERLFCDERSDCASGQSCCLATAPLEQRDDATCATSCGSGLRLCDPARPTGCDNTETTTVCAGNSPVPMYLYCRVP